MSFIGFILHAAVSIMASLITILILEKMMKYFESNATLNRFVVSTCLHLEKSHVTHASYFVNLTSHISDDEFVMKVKLVK